MEDDHAVLGSDHLPAAVLPESGVGGGELLAGCVVEVARPLQVDRHPAGLAEHGETEDPPALGEMGAERVGGADGGIVRHDTDHARGSAIVVADEVITGSQCRAERHVTPDRERAHHDPRHEDDRNEGATEPRPPAGPQAPQLRASEHRDIGYLWDLLAPLGALPLLAPLVTLSALPEIVLNVLSSTPTQSSIHYHYTAGAIPGLIAGAVLGGAKLRNLRPEAWPWVGRGLVALVLLAGVVMGPLPVWRHVPFGSELAARDHIVSEHDRAAARVIGVVPDDAAVSATNTLGAHLSERRRIFSFPVLREARWVAVDLKRPSYLDDATGKQFAAAYAHFRQDNRWRVVRAEDGVIVLHKAAAS